MAVSFGCKCDERKKPVHLRQWRVYDRNCHYSAFSGYRRTYSDYSTVGCDVCGRIGRTKARYVYVLKDADIVISRDPPACSENPGIHVS